jgi:hypothetical protein
MRIEGENGIYVQGSAASGHAIQLYAPDGPSGLDIVADVGVGIQITSDDNAILAESFSNDAVFLLADTVGKKSIKAAQDIQVSDGDLTLAAIAAAVWANAARTLTSFGTLVADIWALAIETGYTAKQSMRLILSSLAGKLSGAATTTVTIRSATDAKDRIVATVDSDGNRTAVTHDTTD